MLSPKRVKSGLKKARNRAATGIKVTSHIIGDVTRASRFQIVLVGLSATVLMTVLYVIAPPILTRLDLKVYDMLLPLRASTAPSPVPVIIDIDEKTMEEYGQFPWPRYLVADLVRMLTRYQVASVGFDIMFAENDNSSPEEMRSYLKRDKNFDVTFGGLPENFYDYDKLLGEALGESPAVLGAYARYDDHSKEESGDASPGVNIIEIAAPEVKSSYKRFLNGADGVLFPLPELRARAPVALINVAPDADGIVRRVPILIMAKDRLYPSLALRSLMVGLGVRNITMRYGEDGMESIKIGSYNISVSPDGTMHVPFIGPSHTYEYISAADVLSARVDPGQLAGRVAFVGTSAAGLMDIRAMPFDSVYPGVEIHAAVLDAMIAGNEITIPIFTPGLQVLGIVIAAIICTVVFGFAKPRIYISTAVALVAILVFLSRRYFARGIFISPLYIIMTIAIIGAILTFLRFWQEEKQKTVLRNAFSKYVSPEIVKRITKLRGDLFAGEERELSIIFTDIRGFTSISEKLSPIQMVSLLNRYFTPMTAVVLEREGTLDKFIGDALMAFWNAPLDVPGHPALAVGSAVAMQEKLSAMNEEFEEEYGVTIRIGAGIHTGPAYVGNMGSADRVNYTLIGDSVNLASRLEGLCPKYGVKVVVSENTMAACGNEFSWQFIDTISVKGKTQPVSIYTPMSHEDELARIDELARWKTASELYIAGDFGACETAFASLYSDFPDNKLYSIYNERATQLRETPPENWDGVWVFTSK
ncbi:guanylate cyclase [Synergistales bacterium]|nr:guanylate cyclase [Synergistales bacterium]